jgi:two-component system chemotaxis sensor kinase CheA
MKFIDKEETGKLTDRETLNLMFIPGLSSSSTVNEISGRGIGMDAVKNSVENMKGSIEVESIRGKGTTFRLKLPLTLAVLRTLLIGVGDRKYAMPISAIAEVGRIMMDDLVTVDGRSALILREQAISVIHLDDLFLLPRSEVQKKFVLIMRIGRRKVGLIVDRLLGQHELVIKPIDQRFTQSDLVAGASVLGDGSVVFVLDASAIFAKAVEKEKEGMAGTWRK